MHLLDPRFFSSHADAVSVVEERDRSEGEQEERAGTETRDHVSKKAGLVAESMLQGESVARGSGAGGEGQRSLLQAGGDASISAALRVVCEDIARALVIKEALEKALGGSSAQSRVEQEIQETFGAPGVSVSLQGPALLFIPPVCGDGSRHETEACDDGNMDGDDGCSAACKVELGWSCDGGTLLTQDTCKTQCGNGVPTAGEECDDGNLETGDGCDSKCAVEKGWLCTVDKSTPSTSNGPSQCRQLVYRPQLHPSAGSIAVKQDEYAVGAVASPEDLASIQALFLNVSLTVLPSTAAIKYTLNGSDPSVVGEAYSGAPLRLMGGTTVVRLVAHMHVEWPFWKAANERQAEHIVSAEVVGTYVVSICQDGVRTVEEECDDGVGGGQGCSMECTVENGFVCPDERTRPAAISQTPAHPAKEVRDSCKDCQAELLAETLEAEAKGLSPPPSLTCVSGKYDGEVCRTCIDCPVGFFCQGGPLNFRYPCDVGTFVDYSNAFECEQCPLHSTSKRRSDSVTRCQCMAGYTGIVTSLDSTCEACSNSYKSSVGSEACTTCPPFSLVDSTLVATRKVITMSCTCDERSSVLT